MHSTLAILSLKGQPKLNVTLKSCLIVPVLFAIGLNRCFATLYIIITWETGKKKKS